MSNYAKISEKLPKMKKTSSVSSISPLVSIQLENGKTVNGYIQRYDVDMNAHHIQAKKGDLLVFDVDNSAIEGASSWALID